MYIQPRDVGVQAANEEKLRRSRHYLSPTLDTRVR